MQVTVVIIIIIIMGTEQKIREELTQKKKRANAGIRDGITVNKKDGIAATVYSLGTCLFSEIYVRKRCIKEKIMMIMIIIIIIIINLWTESYQKFCALYITFAFRLNSKSVQNDKNYCLR